MAMSIVSVPLVREGGRRALTFGVQLGSFLCVSVIVCVLLCFLLCLTTSIIPHTGKILLLPLKARWLGAVG